MSAVSAPSLGTSTSTEKSLEPSGVIRLTICTASTVPFTVVIRDGMDTSMVWPTLMVPS